MYRVEVVLHIRIGEFCTHDVQENLTGASHSQQQQRRVIGGALGQVDDVVIRRQLHCVVAYREHYDVARLLVLKMEVT